MPLDPAYEALIESHISDAEALQVIGWAICYPNLSPFHTGADIHMNAGETLDDAAARLQLRWSPRWLLDAGFTANDLFGGIVDGDTPAAAGGPITWTPDLRLARIDDKVADTATGANYDRRLAAEIAVLGLWEDARARTGIIDLRPAVNADRNTRGATFRDFLITVLRKALPAEWAVRTEVPLTSIRGMHMRKNVGERKSDIVVTDGGNRLVAVISSKWTWRSDRGTEAAQMVMLRSYRPDVPYSLATAEFPRAKVIARESIEDSAFHLCPGWVGAWSAVNVRPDAGADFSTLADLRREGLVVADTIGLLGLDALIEALIDSGTIL